MLKRILCIVMCSLLVLTVLVPVLAQVVGGNPL